MNICDNCGKGLEWGKREDNEFIYYFWRCSWCGYKGDIIVKIPK